VSDYFNPHRNIVSFHVRDEHDHSKVTFALGMDTAPNTEAEAAMALIDRLSRTKIGRLIRCVIYDKALRGVHLEKILTQYGYIPVVKVALAPTDEAERVAREAAVAGQSSRNPSSARRSTRPLRGRASTCSVR
jgi:hypothetical protein